MDQLKKCSVYFMLRILKEEGIFNDLNTLKPYPIMEQHIDGYKDQCHLAEARYNHHFLDNPENKMKFIGNPRVQIAIKRYYDMYIAVPAGPKPQPPAWEDLSPNSDPPIFEEAGAASGGRRRKTRRGRKGGKARKSRKGRKN